MKKLLFYSLIALTLLAVYSCKDDDETIAVSGLTLDKTSMTIKTGETIPLKTTITPYNATNQLVSWTTSDSTIAKVSYGMVSGVKAGVATIIGKAGDQTAKCEVTVIPAFCKVTFDSDGGSKVVAQTVEYGSTVSKPDPPTKANIYFKGWYLEDKEYDFSTAVTSDITLKAHWWIPDNVYEEKAFSVSATKKVYFSSGNLQYHCKNKLWRFAPLQYECIGNDNENISDDYDGYIDLFGWGTGNNPTLASDNYRDYATFTDWGTKIDGGDVWETPTFDEWVYLITGRENATEKYGVAEVAGVRGVILLPDDWKLPAGLSFNSGVASGFSEEYYKTVNNYSSLEWQKMESAGAVFLPAAGHRMYGTKMFNFGELGHCWSSTGAELHNVPEYAFSVHIYSNSFEIANFNFTFRISGQSVRLVRPL